MFINKGWAKRFLMLTMIHYLKFDLVISISSQQCSTIPYTCVTNMLSLYPHEFRKFELLRWVWKRCWLFLFSLFELVISAVSDFNLSSYFQTYRKFSDDWNSLKIRDINYLTHSFPNQGNWVFCYGTGCIFIIYLSFSDYPLYL